MVFMFGFTEVLGLDLSLVAVQCLHFTFLYV